MASIAKRPDGIYRARYRDDSGKEHARHFNRKTDAQRWIDEETSKIITGTWVEPSKAKMTVSDWCSIWIKGYETRKPSTVSQARVHLKAIEKAFGTKRLSAVKPSDVKAWTVELSRTLKPSTVYATYRRFAQVMSDAVHDGMIPRSPCSRRTSPPKGEQRPYVATTAQVWALHDAVPETIRPAILLGAFVGLRVAEVVALRVEDVDFMRGIVRPEIQAGGESLKTKTSMTPVPIPQELALELSLAVQRRGGTTVVADVIGRPVSTWAIERAIRSTRTKVEGLPEGFRFHDLRHYFASLLIAAGLDIKTVQTRLRHASAVTTLNTYGHMFPDKDESARAAVASAFAARADCVRTQEVVTVS